ncbi:hypothetical protein ACET3Z_013251 [Daucus carota]
MVYIYGLKRDGFVDRCLEQGAEDFLVKPVKLSDVERLKDYMLKGQGEDDKVKAAYKRKLQEDDPSSQSLSKRPPLIN